MSKHKDLENFFFNLFLEGHMHVFASLKKAGAITEEIERDYLELVRVMNEVFEEKGDGFSMNIVRDRLPGNKWDPLYRHHKQLGLKPSEKSQRGQELVELLDAAAEEDKISGEDKFQKPTH